MNREFTALFAATAVALLCVSAFAEERDVSGAAVVETEVGRNVVYVGEVLTVRLRVLYDPADFETSVIQPFQRELDVPVHLDVPWISGIAGAQLLESASVPENVGVTIALNDDVVAAARDDERRALGRVFSTLVVTHRVEVHDAGQLVIPASTLRFSYATEFREDFVQGRVPVDRHDAVVQGAPVVVTVLPLPAEGRPESFTGAIGTFDVSASADRTEIAVGETFRLVLRIESAGNAAFDVPRLDGLEGFHVYGALDETTGDAREISYELAPLAGSVSTVPPIPFAFFNTTVRPPVYRVVRTDAIPLTVSGGEGPEAGPTPADADLAGPAPPEDDTSFVVPVVIAILLIVGIGLVARARSQRSKDVHPDDRRVPDAHAALASFDGAAGSDLAATFGEVIAAHLRVPAASVIGPDLGRRLVTSGADEDLSAQVSALLERLVAARYGGAAPCDDDVRAACRLAEELNRTS